MCSFGLYFNVRHRGGGGSEHVNTRTCGVKSVMMMGELMIASFWP
jgi:hypothetical protein